ncbi:hydroxymethylbilane synthase [Streptomyces scopuliridis]|uniref:Hydroxymethylbilane synthase n=1 Tax=Streptomyces scopuliridis TaxID=452529 RepID=A0ACD4ZTB6_9ACTN|nr:hydroxymethylbilane synthase [Streptomyces scopuliridis]WSC01691.1 hydroxymethylbilane synthase [Streptomyces scopuliridis]WSC04770.1 hydroxymethylbilane synthase [Streptomyces scopuliridis]
MSSPSATTVRVATRTSPMAMWQTRKCVGLLRAAHPHLTFETVPITSLGDRYHGPLADIGGKGAFVRALDQALTTGQVELSISCAKDLPSPHDRMPGVVIGGVLERDDARDALILPSGTPPTALGTLPPGSRIGTSAPRRTAQLRQLYTGFDAVPVRGNLNTRLTKLDDGSLGVDALLVAYAGMLRLDVADRAAEILDPTVWLPATGAGIVVVEHRSNDTAMHDLLAPVTHPATATALAAERATLATLHGNCTTAASVHALLHAATVTVHAAVFAPDGTRTVRARTTGPAEHPESVGREAAERLLKDGAAQLLPAPGRQS